MIGTYASAVVVCASALLVGQAVLAACGWRAGSWLAPVIGLGPVIAVAWGAVRLPGEGTSALAAVALLSGLSLLFLAGRVEGVGERLREGAPAAALTLVAASLPFIVEGRFGVLGTGFNVDMSQHLFAAEWLAHPIGSEPGPVQQGYPLGPHGLAVAAAQVGGGNLVHAFGGLTIAIPVIAALCSLSVLRELPPWRRAVAAALVALPYIVASYLAQGQFKELFEGLFVLGFALWLHQINAGGVLGSASAAGGFEQASRQRLLAAVPLAAIALGALYAYSAPGLAWLGGTAILFAAAELYRRHDEGAAAIARRAALPIAVGLAVLLVGAAPELGRVADFQGSAVNVATGSDEPEPPFDRPQRSERGADGGARASGEDGDEAGERHNNELGNLFNQIPPLEALGIWPSGDFRVDPGGGAAPAIAFYAGAALGVFALLFGLARWLRRGETALPAAFAAAALIYGAAWAVGTPYTAAKAVMMIGPLAMLISVRELLSPEVLGGAKRSPRGLLTAAAARAFVLAAAASSLVALGNAPVGPRDYAPGLARMRSIFERQPTLVLANRDELEHEHARDFLAWEARGGDPVCIEPTVAETGAPPPAGIRYVVTTEAERRPPFAHLSLLRARQPYALWELRGPLRGSEPGGARTTPSECGLALGG